MYFSAMLHVLISLILDGDIETDKEAVTIALYFSIVCNGTSNLFGCYNLWKSDDAFTNELKTKGSFVENLWSLEKEFKWRATQKESKKPGACLHNRFQHSLQNGVVEKWDDIVNSITDHLRKFNENYDEKKLYSLAMIHEEYKRLANIIQNYVESFNDFRGCFLIQSLSLMNLYPLEFFNYATFGKDQGPGKMLKHEFRNELKKSCYTKEATKKKMGRSIASLKLSIENIVERDIPTLLLVYIKLQLKAIGIEVTLDDIENILCKANGHLVGAQTLQQYLKDIGKSGAIEKMVDFVTSKKKSTKMNISTPFLEYVQKKLKRVNIIMSMKQVITLLSNLELTGNYGMNRSLKTCKKELDKEGGIEMIIKAATKPTAAKPKQLKTELVLYDNYLQQQMNLFKVSSVDRVLTMRNFDARTVDTTGTIETMNVEMKWTTSKEKKNGQTVIVKRTVTMAGVDFGRFFQKKFQK